MLAKTKAHLFSSMTLPVKPAVAVDGADIRVIQEPLAEEVAAPFFGGYADDFLADLGFDVVEELPKKERGVKRV